MQLSQALREKRPQYEQRHENANLQHDNARPHVAKPVKTYAPNIKVSFFMHRNVVIYGEGRIAHDLCF